MVTARCQRHGCDFRFEDAEHVEDALQKLRAHFRMEHPTKAFYETYYLEEIETLNLTLDEHIARYTGINNWREREGGLETRHIVAACQQVTRHHASYTTSTIDGAIQLAREHGTEIPDPRVQQPEAEADERNAVARLNDFVFRNQGDAAMPPQAQQQDHLDALAELMLDEEEPF